MEKFKPIKVYLVTGFLGAGKTTLLNSLLQQFRHLQNIVIENEFGKVNIDASLVTEKLDQLYELTSGCICCSLDNELLEVLGSILQLPQRPDQLFIETTGIADAGNIIGMFQLPDVKKHFELVSTLCVVDAENVSTRLEQVQEVGKQISCADILIINKIKQLSVPALITLYQQLEAINPLAYITTSENGAVAVPELRLEEKRIKMPLSTAVSGKNAHKINTVLFESPQPFDLNMLVYVLDFYFNVYPDQLYRIKGYAYIKDEAEKFLVQSTGSYLSMAPAGVWEDTPASALVFIGKELKTATMQRILKPAQK